MGIAVDITKVRRPLRSEPPCDTSEQLERKWLADTGSSDQEKQSIMNEEFETGFSR